MTAETKCEVVKEIYSRLNHAEDNTALYMEEMMYCVRNCIGQFVIVKAHREKEAIEKSNIVEGLSFASSEMQDGFYAVKDGVLYQVSLPVKAFENAKKVTMPPIKIAGKDDE